MFNFSFNLSTYSADNADGLIVYVNLINPFSYDYTKQEEQLNEFVNRMFLNATNINANVKEGLSNFRKYLKETKMCEESYLKKLDKIIECSSEILALKSKIGNIDVTTLIPQEEKPTVKAPQKTLGTMPRTSTKATFMPIKAETSTMR